MSASPKDNPFDPVEDAIRDIAAGRPVIVTDDEHRENEGDLVMAASKATTETVNMMIRYCSGVICVPCTEPHLKRLGLNPMVPHNRESYRTDYTVSVDAAEGITTGISAYDRTRTIQLLADDATSADQLVQPGHVFPLRARPGGVLERAGHTEAAVDLAVLAGLHPSGVICEVVNEDGSMARVPELLAFKRTHDLKLISIAALIEYRHKRDRLVARVGTAPLKTEHGDFTVHLFRSVLDGRQHYALTLGEIGPEPTLVRVHSENLIADAFHGLGIGSYQALHASMRRVAAEGCGVILYISQPNGGIDLADTLGAGQPKDGPAPQERGGPAAPDRPLRLASTKMDFRDYGIGAQILSALGLQKIRLLSSTPRKVVALDGYDLEIVEQIKV